MPGNYEVVVRARGLESDPQKIVAPIRPSRSHCVDPFDKIWIALWNGGKLARFDQSTGAWTEFIPPIFPANFRRGSESDAEGNIWVGVWAVGNRSGRLQILTSRFRRRPIRGRRSVHE
jgi:streptogramin lyase